LGWIGWGPVVDAVEKQKKKKKKEVCVWRMVRVKPDVVAVAWLRKDGVL